MPDARGDDGFPSAPGAKGTRSTLRMGPLGAPTGAPGAPMGPFGARGGAPAASAAAKPEAILILPLLVGPYRLAIEASRVVEVVPGGAWTGPLDPERPVANADLYRTLGVLAPEDRETILARADGQLGRGPGSFVAFSVDRADRLVRSPLENLAPLPEVARDQIQVGFIVGVVRYVPGAVGRSKSSDEEMAFLIDPARLAVEASTSEEVP